MQVQVQNKFDLLNKIEENEQKRVNQHSYETGRSNDNAESSDEAVCAIKATQESNGKKSGNTSNTQERQQRQKPHDNTRNWVEDSMVDDADHADNEMNGEVSNDDDEGTDIMADDVD
ncbi:hypothetical protein K7X08_028848 [Anisodus acutangulus]|uniref:Uncharacterized protein n=1 Tax=Anisodus acutangulus TaxID=402998 RepID=A0A9Q1QU47_9SOLA|nr:hypothetical protein K7X08_028848 [Anisodus acutangulus]